MKEFKGHRDLLVWQRGMELVLACYQLSKQFPDHERFGLCSQVQRAAVSIPANIAEGQSRASTAAFLNHLSIANGSLAELETHILIALKLNYVTEQSSQPPLSLIEEVRRMLAGLRSSLKRRLNSAES